MKRFLVFGFDSYYPDGGWEDFKGHADTIEDAWGGGLGWHIAFITATTGKSLTQKRVR